MSGSIFLQIRIGGFRRIENSDSLPGSICGDGGFDATTGAAGGQRGGAVLFTARPGTPPEKPPWGSFGPRAIGDSRGEDWGGGYPRGPPGPGSRPARGAA